MKTLNQFRIKMIVPKSVSCCNFLLNITSWPLPHTRAPTQVAGPTMAVTSSCLGSSESFNHLTWFSAIPPSTAENIQAETHSWERLYFFLFCSSRCRCISMYTLGSFHTKFFFISSVFTFDIFQNWVTVRCSYKVFLIGFQFYNGPTPVLKGVFWMLRWIELQGSNFLSGTRN